MATRAHETFLRANAGAIVDPVLLVGARHYEYDPVDVNALLRELGAKQVLGTDIELGKGVDELFDIADDDSEFVERHREAFATVICLEVLTYVANPFIAARNLTRLLRPGGAIFLAECIVRKTSQMPLDRWRFTYDGLKTLFSEIDFDDAAVRMSYTREKTGQMIPFSKHLPEVLHSRHSDESRLGHFVRRIHRRFLAQGVFSRSRLMPEVGVHAIGRKK